MSGFEHIKLFSSSFRPCRIQKQTSTFLLEGYWLVYLFVSETLHFRHKSAVFTWVQDHCFPGRKAGCLASETTSWGSTALAPCGRACIQNSAFQQFIWVAFSLQSFIFQMCVFLIR